MLKDIYQSSAELHIADPAQSQSCIKVDVYIPKVSKNTRSILCDFEKDRHLRRCIQEILSLI